MLRVEGVYWVPRVQVVYFVGYGLSALMLLREGVLLPDRGRGAKSKTRRAKARPAGSKDALRKGKKAALRA